MVMMSVGTRASGPWSLFRMVLMPALANAQGADLSAGSWTRGMVAGWGHLWRFGVPGWNKTTSDVQFVALHPQLGRFVTDRVELYGEGAVFLYSQPQRTAGAGAGFGDRYHLFRDRGWTPWPERSVCSEPRSTSRSLTVSSTFSCSMVLRASDQCPRTGSDRRAA